MASFTPISSALSRITFNDADAVIVDEPVQAFEAEAALLESEFAAYMGADFIAVTQVMVYVGGVLVLVLFTVMMTRVPTIGKASAKVSMIVMPLTFRSISLVLNTLSLI